MIYKICVQWAILGSNTRDNNHRVKRWESVLVNEMKCNATCKWHISKWEIEQMYIDSLDTFPKTNAKNISNLRNEWTNCKAFNLDVLIAFPIIINTDAKYGADIYCETLCGAKLTTFRRCFGRCEFVKRPLFAVASVYYGIRILTKTLLMSTKSEISLQRLHKKSLKIANFFANAWTKNVSNITERPISSRLRLHSNN